jgi:MFS family permease
VRLRHAGFDSDRPFTLFFSRTDASPTAEYASGASRHGGPLLTDEPVLPMPTSPPPKAGPWQPLTNRTFRDLLVANLASDIGAFMQTVGAAWLMIALGAGPIYIALVQTAATLPFFLIALPAGALGDIVDRRRLILVTEYWMLGAALALAVATLTGTMTPWLLLALTFALAVGDACEAPSWRAILPELVRREELPAANALNGMEFNLARALGPALAGLLIAATGAGAAFVLNAVSFFGVIVVITRWKRPPQRTTAPVESLGGATVAALRYVRHSPGIRTLLVRTIGAMFFATAIMALLPIVATRISSSPIAYGALLACFGSGAVAGALVLPWARRHLSVESTLVVALALLSLTSLAAGVVGSLAVLCPILVGGGAAWMAFISLITTMVQQLAPAWARARVLAVFLLAFQGSLALGSLVWGIVAQARGLELAFLAASAGTAAAILLRYVSPLPNVDVDLTAWNHWRAPARIADLGYDDDDGPVLVSVEYQIVPERRAAFVEAAHRLGRMRRRDGATRWGIYRDTESPDTYVETFIVQSWAEHLRQHERSVRADQGVEDAVHRTVKGTSKVRHFIFAHQRHGRLTRS